MTSPLDPAWTPTADLRAEIERLRAALKEILDYDPSFSWEIARAALADQGKG